jgi:3-hydroxyisobutyrate dehydrogenase-like beta-hydroxyacid dehydrogenase
MPPRTPVGVIGVGLMGEVYARRLVAAGLAVIGYDVDAAKSERLATFGAQAGTLADIAQQCEPIVVAVFNTEQVEDVVEHALVPAAGGKIVLVTSTCDPDRIAALADRVGQKLRFLETPVSGTSEQVRQGDGVGLIGGDQKIAADAATVLDALFPKRFHIGKVGDGGRAKLAVNLILGLNRLALAEGLEFAERLGLDPAAFLDTPAPSLALANVVARLLVEADRLYARAREGIARLPPGCRPAILAAAAIYAEIGLEIARRGHDSVTARARVGFSRKLALAAVATLRAFTLVRGEPKPVMPAAEFLIETVARDRPPRAKSARYSLRAHFVRVLEIFERLERVEQTGK